MTARYGFSTLGEPGIGVPRMVELARANDALGVELRVAAGEVLDPGTTSSAGAAVGAALAEGGVVVLGLSSYVGLCAAGDAARRRSEHADADDSVLADLAAHIRLAAAVGAGGVRVFMKDPEAVGGPRASAPGAPDSSPPSAGELRGIARLGAIAPLCAETGVRVLIETHDSHSTAASVARFLRLSGIQPGGHVAVIWDTAHSWTHGETPAESLDLLMPWLSHLQIKDVRSVADPVPSEPGAGSYPVAELAEALAEHDWNGWAVLEWERAWHSDLTPLDTALGATRAWAADLFDQGASS